MRRRPGVARSGAGPAGCGNTRLVRAVRVAGPPPWRRRSAWSEPPRPRGSRPPAVLPAAACGRLPGRLCSGLAGASAAGACRVAPGSASGALAPRPHCSARAVGLPAAAAPAPGIPGCRSERGGRRAAPAEHRVPVRARSRGGQARRRFRAIPRTAAAGRLTASRRPRARLSARGRASEPIVRLSRRAGRLRLGRAIAPKKRRPPSAAVPDSDLPATRDAPLPSPGEATGTAGPAVPIRWPWRPAPRGRSRSRRRRRAGGIPCTGACQRPP